MQVKDNTCDLNLSEEFLDTTSRARSIKEKTAGVHKTCALQKTCWENEKIMEKRFTNHMSDQGLVPRIYRELSECNKKQ